MSNEIDFDDMVVGYIEALKWTENLEDYDLSDRAMDFIKIDCKVFLQQATALGLVDGLPSDYGKGGASLSEQFGYDFWLTRNGHGTGFWDRNLGDLGVALPLLADTFGTKHAYLGDNSELEID